MRSCACVALLPMEGMMPTCRGHSQRRVVWAATAMTAVLVGATAVQAAPPSITVGYQPMISTGLAAGQPFEAWFLLDKSSDPAVPGYALPAGATVRITFPEAFEPQTGGHAESVMIKWEQGAIPAKFTVAPDSKDPRSIVIHFDSAISPEGKTAPGLKAIHLRTEEFNPPAGDYPITVTFADAGPLSGMATAVAHITPKPVPNIAPYNQLQGGRDEDWQHVKPGHEASLPIDFLVTLPGEPRASMSLRPEEDGSLAVVSDGKSIGSIRAEGVPVTLTPENFGPGFARLGIVRLRAKAGSTAGNAEIVAALTGGTRYTIHLIVD
jgi:hypothetical protein